ncbi:MAG: hypothetical protein OdinLCB4_003795 [Candidatus Odinarchaeum yellowstonii]|uniref:Zinc-ribbon domain-containing protein n=1 Tax=Odinarchaeota yellowstonii (strain LCB_4) TaxID=1841599 RepID=A0AAF0D495_ODILC|nr:MAG: hypothetical protein OdinLCB4_003795 [Candidatus Odinarchaeum yellowstonii]
MTRKIFSILLLVLSVVLSVVVTLLTGVFFFMLIAFLPLIYHFKENVKTFEDNNFVVGEENQMLLYCPRCGGRIFNKFSYCPHCGIRLKDTD